MRVLFMTTSPAPFRGRNTSGFSAGNGLSRRNSIVILRETGSTDVIARWRLAGEVNTVRAFEDKSLVVEAVPAVGRTMGGLTTTLSLPMTTEATYLAVGGRVTECPPHPTMTLAAWVTSKSLKARKLPWFIGALVRAVRISDLLLELQSSCAPWTGTGLRPNVTRDE